MKEQQIEARTAMEDDLNDFGDEREMERQERERRVEEERKKKEEEKRKRGKKKETDEERKYADFTLY